MEVKPTDTKELKKYMMVAVLLLRKSNMRSTGWMSKLRRKSRQTQPGTRRLKTRSSKTIRRRICWENNRWPRRWRPRSWMSRPRRGSNRSFISTGAGETWLKCWSRSQAGWRRWSCRTAITRTRGISRTRTARRRRVDDNGYVFMIEKEPCQYKHLADAGEFIIYTSLMVRMFRVLIGKSNRDLRIISIFDGSTWQSWLAELFCWASRLIGCPNRLTSWLSRSQPL